MTNEIPQLAQLEEKVDNLVLDVKVLQLLQIPLWWILSDEQISKILDIDLAGVDKIKRKAHFIRVPTDLDQ
jgi:hypothetical protein